MNKADIHSAIETFVESKIDFLTASNPIMQVARPMIKKVAMNSLSKYESQMDMFLNLFSDKEGNIDLKGALEDTVKGFEQMDKFTIKNELIGDIQIGKGSIDFEIPLFNKKQLVSFGMDDFNEFLNLIGYESVK